MSCMSAKKKAIFAFAGLLIMLGFSLALNIILRKQITEATKVFTEKGVILLSPDTSRQLILALKSLDKERLEQWRIYLEECGGYSTNRSIASAGVEQTLGLYESLEKPARGVYFDRLLYEIKARQESHPLTKQSLLRFLGPPDYIADNPTGPVYQYESHYNRRDTLLTAVVSNEIVLRIDIGVTPVKPSNGDNAAP